jgi:hypothetical protein
MMQTPVLPLFLSETATLTQASRKLSLGWSVRKTKRFTHFWLSKIEEFRWQIFPRKQLKKRSCEQICVVNVKEKPTAWSIYVFQTDKMGTPR